MGARKDKRKANAEAEGPKSDNETVEERGEDGVQYNANGEKKGKHDRPKPWDTPDIDHWKVEPFDPKWNEGGLLEESSFSTLFPQYRAVYLDGTLNVMALAIVDFELVFSKGMSMITSDAFVSQKSIYGKHGRWSHEL